jgi:hypothetical protein
LLCLGVFVGLPCKCNTTSHRNLISGEPHCMLIRNSREYISLVGAQSCAAPELDQSISLKQVTLTAGTLPPTREQRAQPQTHQ